MANLVPIKTAIITRPAKQKIKQLLELEKITPNDIDQFNDSERIYFADSCTKILNKLTGNQRETFLAKIDQVMAPDGKNDIWEYNHLQITEAISNFMQQYGVMPAKSYIADATGLSRQTVAKHVAAYKTNAEFAGQTEQFKFMAPQVLAHVFKFALTGDMRAARLYFDMIGAKAPNAALTNTHNNYIQINNTILSQENLTRLTTDQLNQIEGIIKGGIISSPQVVRCRCGGKMCYCADGKLQNQ